MKRLLKRVFCGKMFYAFSVVISVALLAVDILLSAYNYSAKCYLGVVGLPLVMVYGVVCLCVEMINWEIGDPTPGQLDRSRRRTIRLLRSKLRICQSTLTKVKNTSKEPALQEVLRSHSQQLADLDLEENFFERS